MEMADIRKVAVIGAGLMGHGIAQEFATAGYTVGLHDRTEEHLLRAIDNIQTNLHRLAENGFLSSEQIQPTLSRITPTTRLELVCEEADLVIEAVFEDIGLKQQVFGELDRLCSPRTILASNTSTFMPSRLAAATGRPDRVLVAHYFNPPYLLPLVEVVPGAQTSQETVSTVMTLLESMGKRPVRVQKEVPGFIGNRIQAAILREAISLVERGIATPQDVDTVVRHSFGRRLAAAGPFEIFDIAGTDLFLAIAHQLLPDMESSSEPSVLLREKVARGELGVKSGKGFHTWSPEMVEEVKGRIARALMAIARWSI
jgi:3-hydroxybutyryl-CoA dehydrogenase